jgi:hypothetical protein
MARASPALTAKARPAEWQNGLSCKRQKRLEAGLALVEPSAKKRRGPQSPVAPAAADWVGAFLALGVLLSLTGLLETGLLTLDDACVAAQVTGLLQGGAVVLGVDLVQ